MTITETGAQWHEARATFIERIDALDAHGEAVGHEVPWPFVSHGKRGTVYLSAAEIDRDRRLSPRVKERLKGRLERAIVAHNEARQRLGLAEIEAAVNAASEDVGRLGHALADDRSGTVQAIVTKLRVLTVEVEDGGDMSGYASGLLASALADAEALAAASDDLIGLHREWSALMEQVDQRHNGPSATRPDYPDYDRIGGLEELIAHYPDTGIAAAVMRLDVALGTFVGSVMCGEVEMLDEGAIVGATRALESLAASAPGVKPWTIQARQRGLERLAAHRVREAAE
ncbi:hypothetical protein SAMN02982917_0026 [Azospirillum oryzae]|uniref:Uncharacterized protein n=1 Tax=Azospirillum oryzae TaxID=286727 RepID=A0A1X7HQ07_9PROT|nr:hypothetical protein [Azospirillum oryzae]SMF90882.1 hypothetical protein SAMN02982917_0026 [Azospirillum oryzae]